MTRSYELASCPACGGVAQRLLVSQDAIQRQVEQLWQFQLKRRRATVPTGQLYDRAFFSQAPPLQLVECSDCGTVFRNPRESELELFETYSAEEPDTSVFAGLFAAQRASYREQAARLTRIAGRTGHGLEVGSYVGAFLAAARERGWDFDGIDVNPRVNAFAREQGFSTSEGSLDDVPAERTYDAITIWNCFDQLPDPRGTLSAAARHLHAGGLLALRVPNGAFYARLNRNGDPGGVARFLLAHNNLLAFPYRHGFTPASLRSMAEQSGFKVVKVVGDALVPTADAWTRGWARLEERVTRSVLSSWPLRRLAPWFELYARKV